MNHGYGLGKDVARIVRLLEGLTSQLEVVMSKLDELNAKVDALSAQNVKLQTTVDAVQQRQVEIHTEQEAIIADLRAQGADGATPEQLEALASRLDANLAALDATEQDLAATFGPPGVISPPVEPGPFEPETPEF